MICMCSCGSIYLLGLLAIIIPVLLGYISNILFRIFSIERPDKVCKSNKKQQILLYLYSLSE